MSDRLEALHRRIDDLTAPDGDFAVVCPRSGKRPVPVRGKSFPTPETAEEAVELVREYREVLREVDPHLESIPFAAVETASDPLLMAATREDAQRANGGRPPRSFTLSGNGDDEWLRMDDAPVVRVREDGEPLSDAAVSLQLRAKL